MDGLARGRRVWLVLLVLAIMGAALTQPARAGEAQQATTDSPVTVIQSLDKTILKRLARGQTPDAQGAMGRNREGFVGVAFQRGALELVVYGIAAKEQASIDQALRGIRYAFDNLQADDSFALDLSRFGKSKPSAGNKASSAAFFLSGAGISYRLLLQSDFATRAQQDITTLRPKIQRAMAWLKTNQQALHQYDQKAPNRLIFDALAFKINGHLLEDQELQRIGEAFLNSALQMQRADGVFEEKGGHDSSYQATSLVLLQYYWFLTQREGTASRIYQAISNGMAWEKARILPTGEVSVEGNTRTGLGQEQFLGRVKDINYREVTQALLFWSGIAKEPESHDLAVRVLAYAEKKYAGGSGASPQAAGGAGLREQIKAKRDELMSLTKQRGISRSAMERARSLYKDAEAAYNSGQLEQASALLDQAIRVLKP